MPFVLSSTMFEMLNHLSGLHWHLGCLDATLSVGRMHCEFAAMCRTASSLVCPRKAGLPTPGLTQRERNTELRCRVSILAATRPCRRQRLPAAHRARVVSAITKPLRLIQGSQRRRGQRGVALRHCWLWRACIPSRVSYSASDRKAA